MENIETIKRRAGFLDWEFGVFFHFGIRTFNEGHRDWDMQEMKLDSFNPTNLDCRQWISTVKNAGATYAVLVCKHHDGFANWPSKYTSFSVAGTPWKDGKGDVVREYVDACREFGIKVGLYYSPAEFGSKGKDAKDYDEYFINQVSELLTNYGKIDYLWFDGNGSADHKYDTVRITKLIRELQPEILLFNMWDPDTRWCGNEAGFTHMLNPLIVNASTPTVHIETNIEPARMRFLPVECDMRMRLHNWFYSDKDEDTVKSLDELMGIYDYTVGRGANLLINIGPNREGVLPEKDTNRLIEFGEAIKRRFEAPIPSSLTHEANSALVELETPELINMVVAEEDIETPGQIENFYIECFPYPYGEPITVYRGNTIGHRAICSFPVFLTKKVRIVCEGGAERIRRVRIYFDKGR